MRERREPNSQAGLLPRSPFGPRPSRTSNLALASSPLDPSFPSQRGKISCFDPFCKQKVLIFKHFSRLDFSIINIPWCSKNCPNISLITFICFCTFLYYIASYLLCSLSILLKKFIHSNIFILLVLFIFVYIPLAFLGNSIHILYFPFISFLVPGRYFAGYGEKMLGIDFHIVIIELIIIFIFFLLSFFKGKRTNLIFLSLLILITGCSSNQNNSSSFQYNSYHELNFAENKEYYYFSNKIIDKNDWKEYSLIRNLYESSNNLMYFLKKMVFFILLTMMKVNIYISLIMIFKMLN